MLGVPVPVRLLRSFGKSAMRYYSALICSEGKGDLRATFPDLAGCVASAGNWNTLLRARTDSIRLWVKENPEIEPSTIDELRRRSDIKAELAKGAIMLLIRGE